MEIPLSTTMTAIAFVNIGVLPRRPEVDTQVTRKGLSRLGDRTAAISRATTRIVALDDRDKEGEGRSGTDWDKSWQRFKASNLRGRGIFDMPSRSDEAARREVERRIDRKVERLTDAWTNENAYLVGIGFILLLGVFYVYVFLSGGLERY